MLPVLVALLQFVSIDTATVALTHARVIDGTGASPRSDVTIVFDHGKIKTVDHAAAIPTGALVIDLTGKTVIPGIVGLHDHMYYGSSV
ncbi:MAG TPA: hypothetical protein VK679_16385, partial [Gemmatimonadaceae bacterium]|nr:hypothetical protein [Gemmatimonadaceae bacterium]